MKQDVFSNGLHMTSNFALAIDSSFDLNLCGFTAGRIRFVQIAIFYQNLSGSQCEDLDFNGGHDFKPSHFNGLEVEIQQYIQHKYETPVWVNKPREDMQGDTPYN